MKVFEVRLTLRWYHKRECAVTSDDDAELIKRVVRERLSGNFLKPIFVRVMEIGIAEVEK